MSTTSDSPPSVGAMIDPGAEALSNLWEEAIAQYRNNHESNIADIEKAIKRMSPTRDMSVVINKCADEFKKFRGEGSKLTNVLTPIADVLSFLVDAGSDAASAVVPGAAIVGTAITGLLDATKKVSELYDTIEFVLGQIRDALIRFKTYLGPSIPLTHKLAESFVASLMIMIDLIVIVTKYCTHAASSVKRFVRRATDYIQQINGNTDVKEKMDALARLTDEQSLQTAAETHANVRELQAIMTYLHASVESHNFSTWIPQGTAQVLHTRLREERADGTCEWILDNEDFWRWRNGQIPILSILGPAGCGKTTVCTFIIDKLQEERTQDSELPDPSLTLAYFYFREVYNKEHENDSLALMNSLALQLAQASPHCWRHLRKEYSRLCARPLTRELLLDMLRDMLMLLGPTFIVIDALDECYSKDPRSSATQTRMLDFLRDLHDLRLPNVYLLVMSRPEPSILQSLRRLRPTELPLSETEEHQAAIARYVKQNLPTNEPWDEAMRKRGMEALTDSRKSQGMFLWVSLQIQHLDCLTTPDEINEALDKLPEGLEQTYRGILQRFRPPTLDVRSVLGFIAFALNPLTTADMFAALSFNFGTSQTKSFKIEDTESFIIRMLPGLIKIVDINKRRIVQFIHFSVKEYLTSDALRRDENMCGYYLDQYSADVAIAMISLATFEPENECALAGFKEYAVKHWHEHIPVDIRSGNWRPDVFDDSNGKERQEAAKRLDSILTAFFKPESLAFRSWKRSHLWVAAAHTPLHCAVSLDLFDLVSRLTKQGVDCDAFADGLTPLQLAVRQGKDSYTKALLESGADPNLTQGEGYTALHDAVFLGSAAAVRTLLDAGADIRARTTLRYRAGVGQTPLHEAIYHHGNQAGICKLLLGKEESGGLGDTCDWRGQTPLHHAAQEARSDIIEVLLDHGASVHSADIWGNTPISLAKYTGPGAVDCAELLEEHLKQTTHSDESSLGSAAALTQDRLPLKSVSNLTLHASLELNAPPAEETKWPSIIECSVNMGWSSDHKSFHNGCMLAVTVSPDDDGSGNVQCAAKLYGVNSDGSSWKILPQYSSGDPWQSFSLSREMHVDCYTDMAASILPAGNAKQHTAEGAIPRLLVHFIPTDKLPPHSSLSFSVPPEFGNKARTDDWNDDEFILEKLATAAVHFRNCRQNSVDAYDSDQSKSGGPPDVEEQKSHFSDARRAEIHTRQGVLSLSPPPLDIAVVGSTSSDAGVAEIERDSPTPSPASGDESQVPQTSPVPSAAAVQELAPIGPTESAGAPFGSPTSILLLCGIVVTAVVVYVGSVHRSRS